MSTIAAIHRGTITSRSHRNGLHTPTSAGGGGLLSPPLGIRRLRLVGTGETVTERTTWLVQFHPPLATLRLRGTTHTRLHPLTERDDGLCGADADNLPLPAIEIEATLNLFPSPLIGAMKGTSRCVPPLSFDGEKFPMSGIMTAILVVAYPARSNGTSRIAFTESRFAAELGEGQESRIVEIPPVE